MPNPSIKPADLKHVRESINMTQGEFASLLGVRRETVNLWEAGRIPMPPYMAFTLAGVGMAFAEKSD